MYGNANYGVLIALMAKTTFSSVAGRFFSMASQRAQAASWIGPGRHVGAIGDPLPAALRHLRAGHLDPQGRVAPR